MTGHQTSAPRSPRPHRWCCGVALTLALATPRATNAEPPPTLTIKPLQYTAGAHVDFKFWSDIETGPSPDRLEAETDRRRFRFHIMQAHNLEWATECQCFRYYTFYVQAMAGGPILRFQGWAKPVGTFADQVETVQFTITSGDKSDTGTAVLPVACSQPMKAATVVEHMPIQRVHINGHSTVSIDVENLSSIIPLKIDASIPSEYDDRLWLAPPEPKAGSQHVTLDPSTGPVSINFDVQPNAFAAAGHSFFSVKSNEENASIDLPLEIRNPSFTNRGLRVITTVHVHFDPSPWLLIAALAGGLVLGCALRPAIPAERQGWFRNSGIAAAAAVTAWFVGAFLTALGCKLVLFGKLELDPWQALPTAMIGLFYGLLGAHSVETVRRLLPAADALPPAPAPPAPLETPIGPSGGGQA